MSPLRIMTCAMIPCLVPNPVFAGDPPAPPPPLFENVTEAAGLEGVHASRVAFADLTGNGYPDAVIGYTQVHLNDRGRRLVRSRRDASLAPAGVRGPNVVQFGDVNNDGALDLYYGRNTDLANPEFTDDGLRSEVWLGDGQGGFRRRPDSGVGAHAETTVAACFLDYDRDGSLDLFVGNAYVAYEQRYEAFPDRLYRGRGDGRFEEVTERAGLLGIAEPGHRDSRKPTYGVTSADWDNDGWPDLLVATYGRQWNRLWRNNGDGTFTDLAAETTFDGDTDRSGTYPARVKRQQERPYRSNGNTFDCAVADFDNDGDLDCFLAEITHWWAGSSSDLSSLLVNQGPDAAYAFVRRPELIARPHTAEHWNQGDLHAGWLDVDNDGRLDLLIASSDYPDEQILRLYHQRSNGTFEDWTGRLGFRWQNASQLSLADFDRDGATDILLGTNTMRLTAGQRREHDPSVGLFRNLCPARAGNRFLNIRLAGRIAGARVIVTSGSHRQMREVRCGLGHAGHHDDTDCRFGMGQAARADAVEVRWPDAAGTVQRFTDVQTDRFYRLRKGGELEPVTP